ncbi:uncharacterized protein ACNLHF_020470 isoform 1-T2 [Anomaloglossus baeobatrachus]|uniref:uncharacterized protein LOC142309960 n=1 Tax=Anomaloglossus baeobatrachus TaxID=238106 RepID=UPI003F4FC79B
MTTSTVKSENGNVSCETPEGTVVHININQRSALDCCLDTFRFFRDMKKSGQKANPSPTPGSAAFLGFGVAFISLGLVSVMLAIILTIISPSLIIFYTGVHFWVGFPFIVSGILNVVAYKFPKPCLMGFALLSLLINFSVSIAGMVMAVNDIQYRWWNGDDGQVCDNLLNKSNDYNYYRRTTPPSYYRDTYYSDYDLQRCKYGLQNYKTLITSLTIMTLLMMIWGLCLSIFSLGFRLKSCCRFCKLEKTEEKDESLLKPDLCDDIIIA